jgi:predicted MFS family arabinose efflux permease
VTDAGRGWPRWGLLGLSAAAAVTLLTELLPAGVLPQMSTSLEVSEGRIGYLASAFALASTAAAIPFTALTRGLPRRPLLLGLLVGLAVANLVTAVSSAYLLTLGVRLFAGLLNGMLWSMLASYAARIVPEEQRGRAIAITLAGITVTLAAGVPAGTALAGLIGWRATFAALAGLGILVAAWIRSSVPAVAGEPARDRIGLLRILKLPGVRSVLVVNGLLLLGHQAMYTYIAPFSARSGLARTSLVLLVFGVAAVAGIWVTSLLVDRHLRPTLLAALSLIVVAICALALFGRSRAFLLPAVAIWGFAFGGAPTLLQTVLIGASGPRYAEVASSIQTTVYNAGIAGGSFIGGVALDARGPGALPWAALLLVLGALIATWAKGGRPRAEDRLTPVVFPVATVLHEQTRSNPVFGGSQRALDGNIANPEHPRGAVLPPCSR